MNGTVAYIALLIALIIGILMMGESRISTAFAGAILGAIVARHLPKP